MGAGPELAADYAHAATDSQYLQQARAEVKRTKGKPTELFAGSCAVSVLADLTVWAPPGL